VAKVAPYHTVLPARPPEHDVYHDHDDCPDGRRIESQNWRSGTDNRPRCEECQDLG